jgi:hypothetical protein
MKIESIEQFEHELKERYYNVTQSAKHTYKIELRALDMVSNAIEGRKPHYPYLARLSYQLGKGSVSTDIRISLYHKALQCLVMAKLASFETPIFYPSMAHPLEKVDELLEMCENIDRINYNY